MRIGSYGSGATVAAAMFTLCATLTPARAQEATTAQAFEGTWKRVKVTKADGPFGDVRFVRLDFDTASGRLKGSVVNPPPNEPPFKIDLDLARDGNRVEGTATWREGEFEAKSTWKLAIKSNDKLEGQCEWLEWEKGVIYDRGFEEFTFERVARDSLGTGPAPEKVEGSVPVDAKVLSGVWRNPVSGGLWTFQQEGELWKILGPDGKDNGNGDVKVTVQGNVLVGKVGEKVLFELGLTGSDKMAGRAAWNDAEGPQGGAPLSGWYGFAREKLPMVDAPPAGVEAKPVQPYADAPAPLTNLRRTDGLYLKLTPKESGNPAAGYTGELRTKDGEIKATVALAPEGKVWAGKATFKGADGSPVELRWEIGAPDEKGVHGAALETGHFDPAKNEVVRRDRVEGWTFQKLRRIE